MTKKKKTFFAVSTFILFFLYFLVKAFQYSKLSGAYGVVAAIYETSVTSFERSRPAKHNYPDIEFYIGNEKHEFADGTKFYLRRFKKRDKVSLLYNPQNTDEVYVNSLFGFWLSFQAVILLFFACVFLYGIIFVVF